MSLIVCNGMGWRMSLIVCNGMGLRRALTVPRNAMGGDVTIWHAFGETWNH